MPVEPTEAMIAAANKLDWSSEDCDGTVHNVWNAMLAAAPTEAKPAQATVLTPAQRRELIDRAGDITDGLNQDDFADEIINQVIAAIKTGASNG